jgi:sugar/nucleoside kinase (ribokinase family)
MQKHFDLLAFGSLTLDTFVSLDEMELEQHGKEEWMAFPVGAKIAMRTQSKHSGGSAANITTGLAKLGLNTGVYGTVGDDDSGQIIRHLLERRSVNTDGISIQKNTPSSSSIIIMTPDGQRTVLHERATYSHFEHFPQGVPETRSLYIGHLEAHEEELFDHLAAWKEKGKFIFWNPGKTQFAQGIKHFKSLYPVIDILFLNTEELELFAEKKGTIESLAQTFIDAGVSSVVVTDSEKGAYSFSAEKKVFQPITDMRPAVCTLGAGDAFAVGVAAAFLEGKTAEEQLLWGTKSSESVIRKYGAQVGQITREELEK